MIQAGLQEEWPSGVLAAIDPFKQGHLIERPPIFYGADLKEAIWSPGRILAGELEELELGVELIEVEETARPPYGIITSQSCEIVEERPKPLQPWVQVAPVYPCETDSPLLDRDFIARLDPPELDEGCWVADLRLEMPLEKSMLVGRTPIESFGEDQDYEDFGNMLGSRRGRPALHEVIHDVFGEALSDLKTEDKPHRKTVRRFRDQIYMLKLGIEEGSRLEPKVARLYVVTRGEPAAEMVAFFEEWWDRANEIAAARGLGLMQTTWLRSDRLEIDLELYDRLVELRSPL